MVIEIKTVAWETVEAPCDFQLKMKWQEGGGGWTHVSVCFQEGLLLVCVPKLLGGPGLLGHVGALLGHALNQLRVLFPVEDESHRETVRIETCL